MIGTRCDYCGCETEASPCPSCEAGHFICSQCGERVFECGRSTDVCSTCRTSAYVATLPEELWGNVDALIVGNHKLPALSILEDHSTSDHSALSILVARYDWLRQHRPAQFQHSHADYWAGFTS